MEKKFEDLEPQKKSEELIESNPSKRKKMILIVLWLIIVFLWLWLLIAYFHRDINYEKYNRTNPRCYEKCQKAYKGDEDLLWMHVEHSNHCKKVCIEPKWNACAENCKLTTLWEELEWKYSYENYKNWFETKYPGRSIPDISRTNPWLEKPFILKEETEYKQWIYEVFSWHRDEIKEYELCEDSCGPAPKYLSVN